jgi:HK97 family phage prohead protease
MTQPVEKRFFQAEDLEIREEDGKPRVFSGYAAVFQRRSLDLGGFFEVIRPGAFARALSERQDVRALIDHESSKILGRSTAGTLRLSEDERGLRVEVDAPDTSYARDLAESLRRKDITQMSFGFRMKRDEWRKEDGHDVRELIDVDLADVSFVTYPAYPDTTAALRSRRDWQSRAKRVALRLRLAGK